MTPIISPWVVYLIYIVNPMRSAALIGIMVVIGIWSLKCFMGETICKFNTASKILVTFFILIAVLLPSESTLTKMLIAQNVTYERVEMVGETVKDVYEDIISLVDGNNEDTEDSKE